MVYITVGKLTALINYDPPKSIFPNEVVITVGDFEHFELEELLDPYKTSPRKMSAFVISKLEKPGGKYEKMNAWFQETETFPNFHKVVTTTDWVRDTVLVSMILRFNTVGEALMFKLKWS